MVLNHVHQYIKRKDKKDWYMCAHPACSSIVPKALIKDKEVTCSYCRLHTVMLDNYQRRLARPKCKNCSNTKEARNERKVREAVEKIFEPKEIISGGL